MKKIHELQEGEIFRFPGKSILYVFVGAMEDGSFAYHHVDSSQHWYYTDTYNLRVSPTGQFMPGY